MAQTEGSKPPHFPFWSALRHVNSGALMRTTSLYALLVMYELAITYILANYLSGPYNYFHMTYDPARLETYIWVCFLTPLSVLPAGTKLESGSQFILPIFMTFVGLPSPIFLVNNVVPDVFWNFYLYLFCSYFLLALCTRIYARPIATPVGERGYIILLIATVLFFAAVFAIGMVQNFHVVSFADLYKIRYSEEESSAPFVSRAATMYIFSFGGLFIGLFVMFGRTFLAALFLFGYFICYGLVQFKTAALAPVWFVYLYWVFRRFNKVSTAGFYIALTAPYWIGVILYLLFPDARVLAPSARTFGGKNIVIWTYLNLVIFRQYSLSGAALGIYYNFFQTHPLTYWSHITGLNFFLRYPYGDHTVAIEMQRRYQLGNWNASFLSTEAIASYGYQALPLASGVVGLFFIVLNTAARGIRPAVLVLMMIMPCLMLNERPLGTSLLTGGIIFLVFYLAWMPRDWLNRTLPR